MKNAAQSSTKFKGLLKKIAKAPEPESPAVDDAVGELVLSFMLWESTAAKAATAYGRIRQHIVDYNDLRVCMPHESVEIIGDRYPLATERSQRLRAALRDIYLREHTVSLDRLSDMGKRDVRKYVESLEGIVPYVAGRVLLRCYGVHVMPVDEHLRKRFVAEEIVDQADEIPEIASWLTRQVKAADGTRVHGQLQAWADVGAARAPKRTRTKTKAKTTSRAKTTKTTTKKKTATTKKRTASRSSSKASRKSASRKKAASRP